ncbi:MAG: tRNA lysidine(34) synthetase TilS [Ndongobacter sp.]|nr:tRNA lysidine(34) synthetase TilS [Ndongobacter sp.]
MKNTIQERFSAHLDEVCRSHIISTFYLAVSGGVDSMALLGLFIAAYRQKAGGVREMPRLVVCHFNHGLRGAESDLDEACVARFCEERGIAFVARGADIARTAKERGLSIETAGREARYRFFTEQLRADEHGVVVTAHHGEDQAESVLMHLFRGCGLDGLCGMSDWEERPSIRLFRPLLKESKATLRQFALQEAIPWREDASNRSTDYLRNRLRHECIPLLEQRINPNLKEAILRMSDLLQEDRDALSEWEERALQKFKSESASAAEYSTRNAEWMNGACLSKELFCQEHRAIQRRIIRRWAREQSEALRSLSSAEIERIRTLFFSKTGKKVCIYGMMFLSDFDGVIAVKQPTGSQKPYSIDVRLPMAETGLELRWHHPNGVLSMHRWQGVPSLSELRQPDVCYFDASKVRTLTIRTMQEGDSIVLFSSRNQKELRRIFTDKKIAQPLRTGWPVVTAREGILWVPQVVRSALHPVTDDTPSIVCLKWRKI